MAIKKVMQLLCRDVLAEDGCDRSEERRVGKEC